MLGEQVATGVVQTGLGDAAARTRAALANNVLDRYAQVTPPDLQERSVAAT